MKAIVEGAGEVGYHVAERLSKEQHDVVVVDVLTERLEYVQTHLDVVSLGPHGHSRRQDAADLAHDSGNPGHHDEGEGRNVSVGSHGFPFLI